ncbi:MAG: complex I subunit 5 family protein [Candidatus Sericytochromatia bacterium]
MEALILGGLLGVPVLGFLGVLLAWHHPRIQASLTLLTSLAAGALAVALASLPAGASLAVGGWPVPYGISLRADGLSQLMVLLTTFVFACATAYHLGQTLEGGPGTQNGVYQLVFPLLLLALTGLFLTADVFNFYVFFELVAVASYLLVSLGRHFPLEAAWKYSAQSVVGSICLLAGASLLYRETGSLAMAEVAARLEGPALWAAPFFLAAFLLKSAVFPFHFWQPDAHAASTTAGSMILAGLLIKVGLYGLFRFWPLLMGDTLRSLFLVIGAVSLGFGAIAAFRQVDAKRMLGYSSISQLGYVLLGLGWGTVGAIAAGLFFLVAHAVAKALLFLATGAAADRSGHTRLAALAGLGPAGAGAAYLLAVLSLAGLPPTAGFVAKAALVGEGLAADGYAIAAWAALGSLMTLAYGVRAYHLIFLPGPAGTRPVDAPHGWGRTAMAALSVALVTLALWPQPLYDRCLASAAVLTRAADSWAGGIR